MLTILFAAVLVVGVAAIAVCASEKKPATVVEHHHHHRTVVIERPVYVQAQIDIIRMEIALAEAKKEPERVRLPEARLLNPATAIERYRSQERKPS